MCQWVEWYGVKRQNVIPINKNFEIVSTSGGSCEMGKKFTATRWSLDNYCICLRQTCILINLKCYFNLFYSKTFENCKIILKIAAFQAISMARCSAPVQNPY